MRLRVSRATRQAARIAGAGLLGLFLAGLVAVAWAPSGMAAPVTAPVTQLPGTTAAAPPTQEEAARVGAIAAQLRCVVCQALSVADSPSTTAAQMRAIILEQLREGKSPDEIKAYFVSRYGEWVLLAPTRSGFNLLVWWLPFVGIGVGVVAVFLTARRWVARGQAASSASGRPRPPNAADRDRLARELERLGE